MTISLNGIYNYQNNNKIVTSISSSAAASGVSDTASTDTGEVQTSSIATGNGSNLSLAVNQALAQLNAGLDLSALFSPASQQSASDFTSSLLTSVQGLQSTNLSAADVLSDLYGPPSGQAAAPVKLDEASPTIKLQTAIQNLITQLGGNDNTSALLGIAPETSASGLQDLQQSFNDLITSSGGNPSQVSLQSFLKTVAANIQGSMSIGSLFDATA